MEKVQISAILLLLAVFPALAQHIEPVPYGDFEQWTARQIKESAIIGGETKTVYTVGPHGNTPWASSNAVAKVGGVTKTSCTVEPAKGPSGNCASLTTRFASCKVAGIVDISVIATGSIYWGRMLEPVTGVKNPYSFMDWGIPFTRRPSAIILDCKADMPCTGILVKGTTFSHKEFPGEDPCQIMLILQRRWEDENGNIHALRVGTAFRRIRKSTDGWVIGLKVPVIYGDARQNPAYKSYMGLNSTLYALNSRGQRKPIIEEGWADADSPVTHAVLQISAGSCGSFVGALDNTIYVDNICLEYPQ